LSSWVDNGDKAGDYPAPSRSTLPVSVTAHRVPSAVKQRITSMMYESILTQIEKELLYNYD
jgi:hypothetical protein